MELQKKIAAFVKLGDFIQETLDSTSLNSVYSGDFAEAIYKTYNSNNWFTEKSVRTALSGILCFLKEEILLKFTSKYTFPTKEAKRIGVIMAGNIPLAGFHDFLCVLLSGNIFLGKSSSKEDKMLRFLAKKLIEIEPAFSNKIIFTEETLDNPQAIIATGSNNSARYFEYYFGKYPNIIRKNRNSAAVLTGNETLENIEHLGEDIFTYYGLGCRNVTKMYVPENYDFSFFFSGIEKFSDVLLSNKYKNNYDYYKSIFLVNQFPHLDNGFVLLRQEKNIATSVAVLNFEIYNSVQEVNAHLKENSELLQCIVSNSPEIENCVKFGDAQKPKIDDFADNVDTLQFLLAL